MSWRLKIKPVEGFQQSLNIREHDALMAAKQDIDKDPNSMQKWNSLIKLIETCSTRNLEQEETKNFITFVNATFSLLFARFPYLLLYWDRYIAILGRLKIDTINVLEKAVQSHPYSIALWIKYIESLVEVKSDLDTIHIAIKQALKYNKYHFQSHLLWDKLLAQSSENDQFAIYLELIQIPLYQYAQYYQKFIEISKNGHDLNKFFDDKSKLQEYLTRFQKETIEDFNTIEKDQVIDDYLYKIFLRTQEKVNAKWEFESRISFPDFDLSNYSEIEKEIDNWENYLDYEIRCYNNSPSEIGFELVASVFERAIIPHRFCTKLWQKYISFLSGIPSKTIYLSQIYQRAINILPMDEQESLDLRLEYAHFVNERDNNEAIQYLQQLYTDFTGSNPEYPYYERNFLIRVTNFLLEISNLTIGQLDRIIQNYYTDLTNKKGKKKFANLQEDEPEVPFIQWNSDTIPILIVYYLKKLVAKNSDIGLIRQFINKIHEKPELQSCTEFWAFCFELEGRAHHNLQNLSKLIEYIKTSSQLPKVVVDTFSELYLDVVYGNLPQLFEYNSKASLINTCLLRENSSNSLANNSSWRIQLSKQTYTVKNEEGMTKNLISRVGHAAISLNQEPRICNPISYFSLEDDSIEPPKLPTYKNVEKATAPISYVE